MPSFATPQFEADGTQLTAHSGLEFMLHLFDSAGAILDLLSLLLEIQVSLSHESTHCLEDRVVALEHDHCRLNKSFESKTASDTELAEYNKNQQNEDCFVVAGLPKIGGTNEIAPREWQKLAKRDVTNMLHKFMVSDVPIVVVHTATGYCRDPIIHYVVKTNSVECSKAVWDKFGFFFLGGVDTRPPELKPISIHNRLTKASHARITILNLFGSCYKATNPGAKVQVVGFESRPLLKLTPPSGASSCRVQTFNFIEVVKRLPANFSKAELSEVLERLDSKLLGTLCSTFVVIYFEEIYSIDPCIAVVCIDASLVRGQNLRTFVEKYPFISNLRPKVNPHHAICID